MMGEYDGKGDDTHPIFIVSPCPVPVPVSPISPDVEICFSGERHKQGTRDNKL
jgi:hypothetical protein